MENEIIQKLRAVLAAPIETEAEVVYLLVEIRKFLDHVRRTQKFPVLRMYCNWVVHISLDRHGTGSILESMDNALALKSTVEFGAALQRAFDIFSFDRLRNELRQFLQRNSLPTNLMDDPAQWGRLLQLYVNVVSECPLVFKDQRPTGCRFALRRRNNFRSKSISSATLVVQEIPDTHAPAGYVTVAWRWEFKLRGGGTYTRSCSSGFQIGP